MTYCPAPPGGSATPAIVIPGKFMASQLQIEANRRNSQFSTGPRSPEVKAASRFNALKAGIDAEAQVIPV